MRVYHLVMIRSLFVDRHLKDGIKCDDIRPGHLYLHTKTYMGGSLMTPFGN